MKKFVTVGIAVVLALSTTFENTSKAAEIPH